MTNNGNKPHNIMVLPAPCVWFLKQVALCAQGIYVREALIEWTHQQVQIMKDIGVELSEVDTTPKSANTAPEYSDIDASTCRLLSAATKHPYEVCFSLENNVIPFIAPIPPNTVVSTDATEVTRTRLCVRNAELREKALGYTTTTWPWQPAETNPEILTELEFDLNVLIAETHSYVQCIYALHLKSELLRELHGYLADLTAKTDMDILMKEILQCGCYAKYAFARQVYQEAFGVELVLEPTR